jgi:SAM-dependent methyltransferase
MSGYILGESQGETERLRAQAAAVPVLERVRWAGLAPGMHAVDAGCGPGEIALVMAQLVGPHGSVDAFDISEARINAGRALPLLHDSGALRFHQGDIHAPPVPESSADFIYCQFVYEYLKEPDRATEALVSRLKPGGLLCVCDADGIGGINWPEAPEVTQGAQRMFAGLAMTGFDALAGRKLFTRLVDAGLKDVRVRVDPVITAGAASAGERANWEQRFAAIGPAGAMIFGSAAAFDAFVASYFAMLADPRGLKLTNLVSVVGRRP